ncbi:MAG: undecaprenyldiphospho-muramoylpentapeptide beta-N-acetylglucosaminyltransferase [Proteobacteria bacterium]|nr:undecaprenyldiphospho-muramoylpentapeptide beta-N-acetylglucosaminyltransferase [Pseudomonadota bacterium]
MKLNTPTIAFTGGGSSGHVTPNIALIKNFQQLNWSVFYIGSKNGIEKELITREKIPYYSVSSGKLRRYFSWQNFLDPFKTVWGILQALLIFRKTKPDVLFSKGGFVAFPVVVAAWLTRIPVIAHESDMTPGLANRLSFPFAKKICLTFETGKQFFSDPNKVLITGTPLRPALLQGNAEKGRQFCGFDANKKVILIYGGGSGADRINIAMRQHLTELLSDFHIIHLCGKSKTDAAFENIKGYKQFEYVHEELGDLLAAADLVISRAGANSIYELLALRKPSILIPLSAKASRGDQIQNAEYFEEKGLMTVLPDERLSDGALLSVIQKVSDELPEVRRRLNDYPVENAIQRITALVQEYARTKTLP